MNLVCKRLSVLALAALIVPASFGASADKKADMKEAQATLLDQNSYKCSNCFFGGSDYYYCFRADNRILIGRDRLPTLNWRDSDKNDLVRVHKNWAKWNPEGNSVQIKYNDKFIWVPRADGKEVRMRQDYTQALFINDPSCNSAVKKAEPR